MLTSVDGRPVKADFTTPTVDNSELPMLLGLQSLRENGGILDMCKLQLHFCGHAGATIEPGPGATTFQLELSPSGHLVLPCSEFSKHVGHNPQIDEPSLTLAALNTELFGRDTPSSGMTPESVGGHSSPRSYSPPRYMDDITR